MSGEYYAKYKVSVPEGAQGDWRVDRFVVSDEDAKFARLRAVFKGVREEVPAGQYTRLTLHATTIMSDTPAEVRDHLDIIYRARGRVLINGLGLGMCAQAVLNKPEVEHVTIVEKSADVIALVAPHYVERFGDRLTVIEADALEWRPPKGVRYGAVWHDIWAAQSSENLPDMVKLHRRYGRCADWQGSWCRWMCEDLRRRDREFEARHF